MAKLDQWTKDQLVLVNVIAVGSPADPEVKQAVKDLNTELLSDEADIDNLKVVVEALTKKLAEAPAPGTTPPVTDGLPVVTGISPTSGSQNGGETITISGTNLNGVTDVKFGTVSATGLEVHSDTSLVCISPAQASGAVPITAINDVGTSAPSVSYTLS